MRPVPPTVSVVICAYTLDRWTDIGDAVASVESQVPSIDEIVLVVDHNPSLLTAAREAFPRIVCVSNDEAPGLSGARNAGIRASRGDIIAFLDDDAAADRSWIASLAVHYDDPRVIAVGGRSEPKWLAGRPAWFPPEFDWVVGCTYRGMPTERAAVRNMIGSNMSFRRAVFEVVGGFDPTVGRIGANPAGCEETEMCIRARAAFPGSSIIYEPAAVVTHTVPPVRGSWGYFRARCLAEGRSKAVVSRLVGVNRGLATERSYASRTLPAGVMEAFGESLTTRRLGPLTRAAAIIAGLVLTSAGFGLGKLAEFRQLRRRGSAPHGSAPT